jgi:hypothetical protein
LKIKMKEKFKIQIDWPLFFLNECYIIYYNFCVSIVL